MTPDTPEQPKARFGEWTRGNAGQVGRCVTTFHEGFGGQWFPIVSWEPHPDEAGTFGHKDDCNCSSCELMQATREGLSE